MSAPEHTDPVNYTQPLGEDGLPASGGRRTPQTSSATSRRPAARPASRQPAPISGVPTLTPEGVALRQARLGELERELRELSQRLKSAREGGSSADDVEWDDVRDRQASVTAEISRTEQELRVCQIVDPSKMATDRVAVGMAVRLKDLNDPAAAPSVYAMVGDREGDPMRKRLSPQSPLGAALLGAVVGQEVGINTPRGPRRYRVMAIAPAPVG